MTRKEKLKLKKLDRMTRKKNRKNILKNRIEYKDFFGLDDRGLTRLLKGKY